MLSRAALRIINCVPPLKRRLFNRMGEGMIRDQSTGRMAMSYRIVFWGAVGWVALCLAPYVYALNDLITWR